jgi:hypothetical protein
MSGKGNRKARKRQRDRSFDRRPGRKPGRVTLRKSEMRWEVAVFGLLTQEGGRLHDSPIHAAEFAASVFNKSVKVASYHEPATDPEEQKVGLSFTYTGGRGVIVAKTKTGPGIRIEHDPDERDDARKNRRDKILREAPKLITGATGADLAWLQISMQALDGLFNAIALGDVEALRYAITVLESPAIGFPISLQKLIPKMAARS